MADKDAVGRKQGVEQAYHVFCPDVLQITIDSNKQKTGGDRGNRGMQLVSVASVAPCSFFPNGRYVIDTNGRIDLGPLGRLRVEGRSPPEVAHLLSEETGLAAEKIHVQVAEHNSQQIYLHGQVIGCQRAVPYQGPETVLDLLQRVGGITPGAAPNDVTVVRSRLVDSLPPLVFHIDLRAIVMNQDQGTNLRLQPFDRVFVGEAKKSSLEKCLPPCLRPIYEKLCGMRRPGSFSYGDLLPLQSLKANVAARSTSGRPSTIRAADSE
jgi:protein involved in polysaccharide export with SLBB domain